MSEKYYKIYFSFLMSFLISGAISFFFTFKSKGFIDNFFCDWIIGGWIYAFPIAFIMAYFLPDYIHRFLKSVIKK